MLKRQRASSPSPLAQPTATELPLTSADSTSEHGAKRRRIFGPPLEEPSRGWGLVCTPSEDEEDENDIMDGCTSNSWANRRGPSPESAGEYKSANSLLHDLHAEQQHRRLMSPSSHLTPPPTPFSYHDWSPPTQQPAGKSAFVIHPRPNLIQDTLPYEKYHWGVPTDTTRDELFCDDVSVYERYEETNR